MSAPSFLLANETNHTLLASLLDFINLVVEHKFIGKRLDFPLFATQSHFMQKIHTLSMLC